MWRFLRNNFLTAGMTFDRDGSGGGGGGVGDDPGGDLDQNIMDGGDDSQGAPKDKDTDDDLIVDDEPGGDADKGFRNYYKEKYGKELPDGIETMDEYLDHVANSKAPERGGGEIDPESLATAIAKALAPTLGDKSRGGDKDKEDLPDLSFPSLGDAIDEAFKTGKITDKEVYADYKGFVGVIQPALEKRFAAEKAMFERQEAYLERMSTVVIGIGNHLKGMKDTGRSAEFRQFTTKYPGFKQEELDKVIANNKDVTNYREAAEFLVWRNPKLKNLLEKTAGKTSDDKNRRKDSFSRFRKGGKGGGLNPVDWKQYILPGGRLDEAKLADDLAAKRISQGQYKRICDKHIESLSPKRR